MRNIFYYWDELEKKLSNKYIMFFLDYDGTLTPIVETPKKANISLRTKDLLKGLSERQNCKVAIISGRALEDIKNMIGINNIFYAGNHGFQIEGPGINFQAPVPPMVKIVLKCIKDKLQKRLLSIHGILIEDKEFTLGVHYRMVKIKDISLFEKIFNEVLQPYINTRKVKIRKGKKTYEIRPPVDWDKGKCVLWLLKNIGKQKTSKNIIPIYIGDDLTDEDAFEAIREKGITIYVGRPKKTYAEYYVKSTKEVSIFLKEILSRKKNPCLN